MITKPFKFYTKAREKNLSKGTVHTSTPRVFASSSPSLGPLHPLSKERCLGVWVQQRNKMADELVEKVLQKARVLGLKIRDRIISTEGKSIEVNLADMALSSGLSAITFPLCLGAFQSGIFRPLRMTSNIRVIGSVCGGISVLISSSAASLAFLSSSVILKEVRNNSVKVSVEKFISFVPVDRCSVAISVCYKDIPLYGFASLPVFKLLGGKFRSVLPSSLIYPGVFAKGYIPAKGQNYASNGVKHKLALLGEFFYSLCNQCSLIN